MVAVVALVVAAAVAGGVVALGSDDGGDEPSSPASTGGGEGGTGGSGTQAWTAPAVEGDHGEVIRTVVAGSALVVVTQRDATSIERSTGEQNWFRSLEEDDEPGLQYAMCGAGTVASDDGKLPVTFGVDPDPSGNYDPVCGFAGLLDLSTGDVSPAVDLASQGPGANGVLNAGMPIEIVGDTVLAAWNASVFGLGPDDLSTAWRWDVAGESGRAGHLCEVDDMARGGTDRVVVLSSCVADTGEALYFLDELTTSGEASRSHQITAEEAQVEISSLELVSADPVVVAVRPSGSDFTAPGTLLSLDESWNVLGALHDERFAMQPERGLTVVSVGSTSNRTGAWHDQNRSLAAGDTLYTFTAPAAGANELVALDLGTGDELWTAAAPEGSVFWQVLAVGDDTVTAVATQNDGPVQSVVTVDRTSGDVRDEATTEVLQPDGDPITGLAMANQGFLYADGRAYAVEHGDAGEPDEEWLAYTVG